MLTILILGLVSSEESSKNVKMEIIDSCFANGEPTYSITRHKGMCKKIREGQLNVAELRQNFADALASQSLIKDHFNGYKLDQLKKILPASRGNKKDIIDDIIEAMLREFAIKQNISFELFGKDSYLTAIKKAVYRVTQSDLEKEAAEYAKGQAFKEKATKNPETLEEFEYFIRRFGEAKLSPGQKMDLDELRGISNLEQQEAELERKAIVSKIKLEIVEFNLVKHYHTKRSRDVFTVTLSGRVDKETFNELCQKARMLEGNYAPAWRDKTNNRVSPAGFTFDDEEQAKKFMMLKEGDVSRLDELKERQEEKKANAIEHLQELHQNLSEQAQETLNKERKVNTTRRARIAKSIKEDANEDLQLATTIGRVVEAIEGGQTKFLTRITAKTHVEVLEKLLDHGKYQRRSKLNQRYEDIKFMEPETEDVNFVEYPYPVVHKHYITKVANKKIKGLILITNKFAKLFAPQANESDHITIKHPHLIEQYQKIVNKVKIVDKHLAEMMSDRLVKYQRLQVMGLTDVSILRAALREYLPLRENNPKPDPVEELEFQLAGTTIEGYFPTPPKVVERMLELVHIEPGMEILEPSGGSGHLVSAIRQDHPEANISVVEINSQLRKILEAKGFRLVGWDFFEHQGFYDRVIMNPPFSGFQDVRHVKHAYTLLKPGGKIVAIMSESPFFRNDKEAVAFRQWLDDVGGSSEKLPQGSFLESDRSTGVSTRLVIINKPNDAATDLSDSQSSFESQPSTESLTEESLTEESLTEESLTEESLTEETMTTSFNPIVETTKQLETPLTYETQQNLPIAKDILDKLVVIAGLEADMDVLQVVANQDFLSHEQNYHRIILCLSFKIREDISYIQHGYDSLNPAGRLVAVVSEEMFSSKCETALSFRRWLKKISASSEKLETSSDSKATISRVLIIDKYSFF